MLSIYFKNHLNNTLVSSSFKKLSIKHWFWEIISCQALEQAAQGGGGVTTPGGV